MTTIAYNHKDKEIAVDSRKTKGNFIADDYHNKIRKTRDATFILAGNEHEIDSVVEAWPEMIRAESCYGFVVVDGVVKWISSSGLESGIMASNACEHNETAGSGSDYAIAAMDMGASAKQAVEMAIKRDVFSGGNIQVIYFGDVEQTKGKL